MNTATLGWTNIVSPTQVRIRTAPFSLFLGVAVILCFGDVLAGLKTFVYRDFGLFAYPLAHHWRESFWRGELPLWNPFNNCGLPFLAQWNTMVLYPPSLFYVLLPMPWSLNVFCVLHLFLAGLGMYRLGRKWSGSDLGGAVAGTAFAFNGLTLCALMWPNNIAALGWMPWVILVVQKSWEAGGRALLVGAVVGTLQMLTGAPEIILFTWLFVGTFFFADWLRSPERGVRLLRFALVVLLVVGLSAAQLMPFLQLLSESHRTVNHGGSRWSMPAWGWANLIVPLFRMNEAPSGVYFQLSQGWTSSYYIGVITLVLGATGLIANPRGKAAVLGGFAALGLILALGDATGAYGVASQILPVISVMRYPIKLVTLAVFAISLLAAYGVARCETPANRCWSVLISCCAVTAFLAAVIVTIAYLRPQPEQLWSDTFWSGVTRFVFLAGVVGLMWRRSIVSRAAEKAIFALLVVTLTWLDTYTHTPRQNPTVDASVYSPELLKMEPIVPKPELGQSRAMLHLNTLDAFATNRLASHEGNFLLMRLWQYENLNLLEGIPKPDGFFSLYLPHERALHFRLYGADGLPRAGLGDFLGVAQVTTPTDGKGFRWSYRDTHRPLATLSGKAVFCDSPAILTNLMLPSFDPRSMVFVSNTEAIQPLPTNATVGRILHSKVTAHRLRIDVETDDSNLLVLAQADYPAWKAYLDGKQVPIHRANYAFQAIAIPPGRHTLDVRYEDVAFRTVGSSRVDLQACKLEYSIVSPK